MELEIILWAIFDLMALGPVLLMHQKNFGSDENQKVADDSNGTENPATLLDTGGV